MEDPAEQTSRDLGEETAMRPVVPGRIASRFSSTRQAALVDSGSERTYSAPGLAREIGRDLSSSVQTLVGLGGDKRLVRFAHATIQLHGDLLHDDQPLAEWEARIGFLATWEPPWSVLLGQRGFLDQFTVTMHRSVPALVVEAWEAFDQRFGVRIESMDTGQPRFRP